MKKIIPIIILIISFAGCNQLGVKQSKIQKTVKKQVIPPVFNSDSAYSYVEKQVAFGPRVPETEANLKCAQWLEKKFTDFGATVIVQEFKARTYDNIIRRGHNIIASYNPEYQKRILLMAHWDSRPFADYDPNTANHNTPIDGANDGASGVGVLLEMARQFGIKNPQTGIDIVLFDLEDWGPPHQSQVQPKDEYWGLGSQYWAKNPHKYGYTANFGILLDMVGNNNLQFRREYFSDREASFVVDLVWNTARDMGYDNIFINEQGGAITDDHVFVNKYAKIPSIDIIHLDPSAGDTGFFEHWHTINDNMDVIETQSLQIVGDVLMMVVYNE